MPHLPPGSGRFVIAGYRVDRPGRKRCKEGVPRFFVRQVSLAADSALDHISQLSPLHTFTTHHSYTSKMPPKLQVTALSRALVRAPCAQPVQRRQLHFSTAAGPSTSRPLSRRRSEPTLTQKREFHASNVASASQKDPYDVLGVARDAKAADIKKAYSAVSPTTG